jgi:hypothetical protein
VLQSIVANIDKFHLEEVDDDQLVNCLAEFLDIAWQVHFEGPSGTLPPRDAFRAVLRRVAAAGNPLAIDLEQRVSGRA